jgi:hypothetical protein
MLRQGRVEGCAVSSNEGQNKRNTSDVTNEVWALQLHSICCVSCEMNTRIMHAKRTSSNFQCTVDLYAHCVLVSRYRSPRRNTSS